ncbi:MAG: formylglycine-generating enzyme family protein [Cyanobacteria bacterium P01_H01_bin.15]
MSSSLQQFIADLREADDFLSVGVGLGPGIEEIADMLWLSRFLPSNSPGMDNSGEAGSRDETTGDDTNEQKDDQGADKTEETKGKSDKINGAPPTVFESMGTLIDSQDRIDDTGEIKPKIEPIKIPAAPALRHPLEIARALRPLIRKVNSRTETVIDEEETAIAIAQGQSIGVIEKPAQERWLELELIFEESKITAIWERAGKEFAEILERLGAFRTIRVWTLTTSDKGEPQLKTGKFRTGQPKELTNSAGQRLVMLVSDCISSLWREGKIHESLATWADKGPAVIIQWFPSNKYWSRTGLGAGEEVWLRALNPATKSKHFKTYYPGGNPERRRSRRETRTVDTTLVPVVPLETEHLGRWAKMMAGGDAEVAGRRFELVILDEKRLGPVRAARPLPLSGEERVRLFFATASPLAQRLGGLLSWAPPSAEIANLLQETLLKDSEAVHLAEVFLSGVLEPNEQGIFHFLSGAAELLQESTLGIDKELVHNALTSYVSSRYLTTPREFRAFLARHDWQDNEWKSQIDGFADLLQQVEQLESRDISIWRNEELTDVEKLVAGDAERVEEDTEDLGHDIDSLAELLEQSGESDTLFSENKDSIDDGSEFTTQESLSGEIEGTVPQENYSEQTTASNWIELEFETASVELIDVGVGQTVESSIKVEKAESLPLLTFEFETVQVSDTGNIIKRLRGQARFFVENLGETEKGLLGRARSLITGESPVVKTAIEMIAIPGGAFMMGEKDLRDKPQHEVSVPSFFLSKYPITQAQWRLVAALPQVERELQPNPSRFKGDNRPIERVSWYDAVEFCKRLSQFLGREYRLPTEAEWEYACRAGTNTPFYFGEIITTDLGNYNGSRYGEEPSGQSRGETTEVGSFPPNGYGLYDMHGNVYDWCLDHWHDSYEDKPESLKQAGNEPWLTKTEESSRVVRGGSWFNFPDYCRSAYRNFVNPGVDDLFVGFRVVCGAPSTLLASELKDGTSNGSTRE